MLNLPDGVASALESYLDKGRATEETDGSISVGEEPISDRKAAQPGLPLFQVSDLCPAYDQAALVNTDRYRRYYACGHSEC